MLDALALFVTIVEAGSLSAAAERLDLPAATVTRIWPAIRRRLSSSERVAWPSAWIRGRHCS